MDLVRGDVRPSSIVTREALENAVASVAATGGSTNGVLHLLAIAREFGVPLTIDEIGEIAERLSRWQAPPPRYTKGVFAKYAAHVGSASEGAPTW